MATAANVLGWARGQIGTVETGGPHGNDGNRVPYWDLINMHGDQGQPWCAAFVLAGLEVCGVGPVTLSVYVPQIENDYKHARRWYPIERALPGDQVIYNWADGHTGFVVSVDPNKHTVTAIEGNTSIGNAGSQDNGGGVYQRVRAWSLVSGVGRPAYDPAKSPQTTAVTPYPEDHMKCITVPVPGLDAQGHGYTDLPDVPAGQVISVRVNTADYAAVPASAGDQDCDGHARIEWTGPANAPAFTARVWVTG